MFFGFLGLAALLVMWFLLQSLRSTKPLVYQGRPIEYWFARLPVTPVPPPGVVLGNVRGFIKSTGQYYGSTNLFEDTSLNAMAAFGTNALPFLLARLQGLDSVLEQQVTKAATNAGVAYLPFRRAELERLQAVTALIHAETLTEDARQRIVALCTNSHPDIAAAAAYILNRRKALIATASAPRPQSAEPNGAP